jgi:hypothetical protein
MIDAWLREAGERLQADTARVSIPPLERRRSPRPFLVAAVVVAFAAVAVVAWQRDSPDASRTAAGPEPSSASGEVPGDLGAPVVLAATSDAQVTVRVARSGRVQDGYCLGYSPGGTATCSSGDRRDPVTSGVRIVGQGTDEVAATVWETAPDVDQIIVTWGGGSNVTARVVHPWSGSAAGFAAAILPSDATRFTYYSEDADGRGVDSGVYTPSTRAPVPPVSAAAVGWIADPAALPAGWVLIGASEPNVEGAVPDIVDRVTTLFHYNADKSQAVSAATIQVSQAGVTDHLLDGFPGAPSSANTTVRGQPGYAFSVESGDNVLAWVENDRWIRVRGPFTPTDEQHVATALLWRRDAGLDTGWLPAGFEQVAVAPPQASPNLVAQTDYAPSAGPSNRGQELVVTLAQDVAQPVEVDLAPEQGRSQQPYAADIHGQRAIVQPDVTTGQASATVIRWQIDSRHQLTLRTTLRAGQALDIARHLGPVDAATWNQLRQQHPPGGPPTS